MAVSPLSLIRGIKYTAVDFGHNSIKYLSCRVKNNQIKLITSGRRELPVGTIKNGKIVDTHLLTKIISEIFSQREMKNGVILLTPASGQEFVRNIKMPKMPKDELKKALIWEVQDFLDLPAEKIALDYIISAENKDQYELLVTVLSKDVLNSYLEVFNNNMLDVKVVNLKEMALTSLLSKKNSLKKASLILDIGAKSSKIIIAKENKLYLSREVNTSGDNFSNLFLKEEGNYEEAEIDKKKFKFHPEQAEDEQDISDLMSIDFSDTNTVQKQVKNLADELIYELNRSLEYHNERNSDNPVTNIYLTGGTLLLDGLIDYIKSQITADIKIINPLKDFEIQNNFDLTNRHFIAAAAGTIISEVMYNES